MATDKPRFSITIPDDILAQVERYQADRKISTKSKAIQKLIVIGLEGETEDYETETREIARRYRALDAHGRRVVDAVMEIEAERGRSTVDLSDYRMVARSGRKLTPDQMETARKVIEAMEKE